MAGFIRRFGYFPGIETITLIEGVIIVDLPPPGSVNGVGAGTVALVGEFPDFTYATAVSSTGVVSTKAQPVEVFTAQDMLNKVGGYDSTLGDTGLSDGNGFLAVRNKKFSKLVLVPVNLASSAGGRCWRDLPTNFSSTQAVPVVPLTGGSVSAGREFRETTHRVHIGKTVNFTAVGHYKNNVDGSVTAAGAAVTGTFTSALGGFLTAKSGSPVKKGDLLVLGVISGAGALGANAFTFRVVADAVADTTLTVEKMDGSSFTWSSGTTLPYRIHPASDGDSAGVLGDSAQLSDTAGYRVPCRVLDAGGVAAATLVPPVSVPPVGTASSWDALSGLQMRSHVSTGFVFVAATQTPNVNATSSGDSLAAMEALYATAVDALLNDEAPSRDVNILFLARTTTVLRAKVKSHVLSASAVGVGRIGINSPGLTTVSVASVTGSTDPGVGTNRNERVLYSWPGVKTYVPEAVGISLGTADGSSTMDGILDTRGDGWLAAVLSNLPPERNPGQATSPVPEVLAPILGFQRAMPSLGMQEYMALRAAGICGLRNDVTSGFIFQSGVTSSLTSGEKNINRRRMADFVQDSLSRRLVSFAKLPLTQNLKDTIVGEIDAFLVGLQSPNNPPAQRISGFLIDDISGNTPDLEARGVYVVITKVRTLATNDFFVLQTEVGEGVNVTVA